MKKLTTSEIVLQFMINKNQNYNDNKITMTQDDARELRLPEKEIIRAFYLLQTDGYLKIIRECRKDDFSTSWAFELSSYGIHYFEKKNEIQKEMRDKWIQFWIPVSISFLALIIASISLVLELLSK